MANNSSHTASSEKDTELSQQLPQTPEMNSLQHSFTRINIDAPDEDCNCLNTTLSVYSLLASLDLGNYMDLFAANSIGLEQFLNLSYLDLQLLGINDSRHRNLIMDVINAFRID
ncbi:uncharacterized protein LOC129240868 isoform X1 [Anastrepha obliqua]|uniref:uncharacterized protein LOC129240868 isoform X1 n=1 Tax=Anastrepha obliqua TaxID=95512 RepID=UPI00240956A2|nr:uncharacterized protein LOC129240868 isoform X1 [Anastrepha obliqua]